MKRIAQYISLALLSLIPFGCNDLKESAESLTFPEAEIILTATREAIDPGTRSFRLDDGSVWWSPNEEVSVFYGSGTDGGSKFVSMNTSIAETVELQGSIQMTGSGKAFWAVYPYSQDNTCDGSSITTVIPSSQIGVEGNFSDDVFPAMAKGSSTSLPFWNICGGIKFFVSRTDIKSVTIKGNNNEILAGKVKVAFSQDGKPEVVEVIDGKTEVTLNAPEGAFKVGKYYYITLLPASLNGGFTMTLMTDSEIGRFVSNSRQTVKRSTFGVLKNIDAKVSVWESTIVEPEWVDLGLSVKWATMNLGATKPEEYGDYYAWGETEKKEEYSLATYKWCNGSINTFTKYNGNSYFGTIDYKAVLDIEDDPAHIHLGGYWRTPTSAEIKELIDNCKCASEKENGVSCYRFTSKINGHKDKSILIPAAGYYEGSSLYYDGSFGHYWSSSLSYYRQNMAMFLLFYSGGMRQDDYERFYGFPIRPVYGEFTPVLSIQLDKNSVELNVGTSTQLTATISPSNATAPDIVWVSENESIASVDQSGTISAVSVGQTNITAYASNGLCASCTVSVTMSPTDIGKTFEAVDLGLPSGLKWATFNIGATKPEQYGDYFAWGEIEPKANYLWDFYKWCDGTINTINKYNTHSSSGTVDGNCVLFLNDDAAHVILGGAWRMPTDAEWTELRENCTWTWGQEKGVNGLWVTGKKSNYTDKSIFIPAAGDKDEDIIYNATDAGYYWTSSLDMARPYCAKGLFLNVSGMSINHFERYTGLTIRPVYQANPKEIAIDFTQVDANLPQGDHEGKTDGTYTIDGYTLTLHAADKYYQGVSSGNYYLLIGKKDSYVEFPAIDGKSLVKVEFLTGANASENVIIDLAKADGSRLNVNKDKLQKNKYYVWELACEPGVAYRLLITNAYNAQFQTIKLTYR